MLLTYWRCGGESVAQRHAPIQEETTMPDFSGSFAGQIKTQTAIRLTDQPNHDMSLAEVTGTQKSSDARWHGGAISYWASLICGTATARRPATSPLTTAIRAATSALSKARSPRLVGRWLSKARGSLPTAPASSGTQRRRQLQDQVDLAHRRGMLMAGHLRAR